MPNGRRVRFVPETNDSRMVLRSGNRVGGPPTAGVPVVPIVPVVPVVPIVPASSAVPVVPARTAANQGSTTAPLVITVDGQVRVATPTRGSSAMVTLAGSIGDSGLASQAVSDGQMLNPGRSMVSATGSARIAVTNRGNSERSGIVQLRSRNENQASSLRGQALAASLVRDSTNVATSNTRRAILVQQGPRIVAMPGRSLVTNIIPPIIVAAEASSLNESLAESARGVSGSADRMRALRQREANRISSEQQRAVSSQQRDPRFVIAWRNATRKFDTDFTDNDFGHACFVCDRLWFRNALKDCQESHRMILESEFGTLTSRPKVCENCRTQLNKGRLPNMSRSNGFKYPDKPQGLPELDPITERLISPRLPFMQIRRLRRQGQYSITGQVINVPVDVETMVRTLPRQLDDDYAINVAIMRKMIHKTPYLSGQVSKRVVRAWLQYLVQQPLYRQYRIEIDLNLLDQYDSLDPDDEATREPLIERILPDAPAYDVLLANQHTMLWNENSVLHLAPGQNRTPLNMIFDHFCEELSFPAIYYGHPRQFKDGVRFTPYTIATSEIRRRDRRGAVPDHVLYMAMKIMRIKLVDGIRYSFCCTDENLNITRAQIESPEFLEDRAGRNFAFLKSLKNSAQYWQAKKRDLFALIRQLGKPTLFMTLSASETRWPKLVKLLHKLNDYRKDINVVDPINDLTAAMRAHLVNEDPVTCCIYFKKLIDVIMNLLASSRWNPFRDYKVVDYFERFEFQQRGSVHAHIMIWLANDPQENVSENMPETVKLATDLFSVSESDLPDGHYRHQVHSHTFTCRKRGETSCRFGIPYWPMGETMVLMPMASSDRRRVPLKERAKGVHFKLESLQYQSIELFLRDNNLDKNGYLDMIRATLSRPTMFFKRNMSQIRTNTFNPWIAGILNSNMDIQFIIDEYSCATYVVDYVNKSNRGISNLHRELLNLRESDPGLSRNELMKKISLKVLNTVEMCAQEAAWYLLRQPMAKSGREVVYIPTDWPSERQKSYKSKAQMNRQNLEPNSTDIWTKNIIEKYEDRVADLSDSCLADFAAWYTTTARRSANIDDPDEDEGEEEEALARGEVMSCRKRSICRVIRYRNYDPITDTRSYKREMVTLYIPFKNEHVEIIDQDKFDTIYDQRIDEIALKKAEYEKCTTIEQITAELARARAAEQQVRSERRNDDRQAFAREILPEGEEENFDDVNTNIRSNVISMVRQRTDIMSKEEFVSRMRSTNPRQREILLEFIHRLKSSIDTSPIQIFFTGPAGCGKTYTLKLIMEVFNRFGSDSSSRNNTFIACASTGKAAVQLGGVTMHSAFKLARSLQQDEIPRETLQQMQSSIAGVKGVIVDEVSMVGDRYFTALNDRLQQVTGEFDSKFGGLHIIFTGDLRQLPPVNDKPVYVGSSNHLQGAALWQSLGFFNLTQVMRQSDSIFSTALTKLGDGIRLNEEEINLFRSRFRTKAWTKQHKPTATRLFHTNRAVEDYNSLAITNGVEHRAKDTYIGHRDDAELRKAKFEVHKLDTTKTANLPHSVSFQVGLAYMVTANIDVEDKLVNGAIGIFRYLEELPIAEDSHLLGLPTHRTWLEFEDTQCGASTRVKYQSAIVSSRGAIQNTWTPVACRSANIKIEKMRVVCKRIQFPVVSALAMTIHKSQGGTFDEIVLDVNKKQSQQLHYVGASRVSTLEGLYLTNEKDEFIYYHGNGCDGGATRRIRDEYARLRNHPLETLTYKVKNFIQEADESHQKIVICTINAESLNAHSNDISTDEILSLSDILIITETWMRDDELIEIEGFKLIAHCNKSSNRGPSASGEENNNTRLSRTAGGSAIYCKLNSGIDYRQIPVSAGNRWKVGDTVVAEIKQGEKIITIAGIYIHPSAPRHAVDEYLTETLSECTEDALRMRRGVQDASQPLLVSGDFNNNVADSDWLPKFMQDKYSLTHIPSIHPTTMGNTFIDLTFTRDLSTTVLPYVCYFSYHRPLFNKVLLPNESNAS